MIVIALALAGIVAIAWAHLIAHGACGGRP
jgi:hypothetical protein